MAWLLDMHFPSTRIRPEPHEPEFDDVEVFTGFACLGALDDFEEADDFDDDDDFEDADDFDGRAANPPSASPIVKICGPGPGMAIMRHVPSRYLRTHGWVTNVSTVACLICQLFDVSAR